MTPSLLALSIIFKFIFILIFIFIFVLLIFIIILFPGDILTFLLIDDHQYILEIIHLINIIVLCKGACHDFVKLTFSMSKLAMEIANGSHNNGLHATELRNVLW